MSRFAWSLERTVPRRFRAFRPRLALVVLMFALWGLVLAGRAVHLQVVRSDELAAMARQQSQRTIPVQGQRGPILDREGNRLALSLLADSFFARPAQVRNPARTAFRLARVLDVPRAELEARLRSDRAFVWLRRQVPPDTAAAVDALALAGIGRTREYNRVYPNRELGAALLGFTGVDNQGLEGLEYAYDSVLQGAESLRVVDTDALGRTVLTGRTAFPDKGGSIRLTLHPGLQQIAEDALERAVTEHEARRGTALALHSRTGEILAVAHAPGYNPNAYQAYDKEAYFNRAVTSGYEPGSTMKVITAAVALEEDVATPESLFYCEEGAWEHYDSKIHDTSPHGWLTVGNIIRVSSNICAAKMAMLMPPRLFHEYITRFGFGRRAGLFTAPDGSRLAGEAEGYVLPAKDWTPVDQAAMGFGHGLLVSPLQLGLAVNAIGIGGELLEPVLVREVRDSQGEVVRRGRRRVVRRVISQETAASVRAMMEAVVHEGGSGTRAAVPGYRVAGKTGTTELYDIEARGYSDTQHIASFAGFVPADDPALTIVVMVQAPKTGRYGGIVAAPVFREIAERGLPLLGVWPDGVRVAGAE